MMPPVYWWYSRGMEAIVSIDTPDAKVDAVNGTRATRCMKYDGPLRLIVTPDAVSGSYRVDGIDQRVVFDVLKGTELPAER